MKKIIAAVPLLLVLFVFAVAPVSVLAHGHTSFEINEKVYSFTVGSLNEPIAVDDKSGLDLRVVSMAHHEEGATEHAGAPVVGLENTLKVELIAGEKKKVLDISPAYGDPGAYRAYFIPTVQTTFGYRIFGTIENIPFNYTFTCNPAGHPQSPADKTKAEVSKGVTRIEAAGAFSCPTAKADLGFPEPASSLVDLSAKSETLSENASKNAKKTSNLNTLAIAALALAVVGVALGVKSNSKK